MKNNFLVVYKNTLTNCFFLLMENNYIEKEKKKKKGRQSKQLLGQQTASPN